MEQCEVKYMTSKREQLRGAASALSVAMNDLKAAKTEAMEQCEVNWDSEETTWDSELKGYADSVASKAAAAQAVLSTLDESIKSLDALCSQIENGVTNRAATANALVANFDKDSKERLAPFLEKATSPVTKETALELNQAKVDMADARRELAEATGLDIETSSFA